MIRHRSSGLASLCDTAMTTPALLAASIGVVARHATLDEYTEFVRRMEHAPSPQEEERYRSTLADVADPTAFATTLKMCADGRIRTQDAPYLLDAGDAESILRVRRVAVRDGQLGRRRRQVPEQQHRSHARRHRDARRARAGDVHRDVPRRAPHQAGATASTPASRAHAGASRASHARTGAPRGNARFAETIHADTDEVDRQRMRFRADVFAIEDTTVQLTWRGAPAGPVAITVSDGQSTRTTRGRRRRGTGRDDRRRARGRHGVPHRGSAERRETRPPSPHPHAPHVARRRAHPAVDHQRHPYRRALFRAVAARGRRARTVGTTHVALRDRRPSTNGRGGARNTSCSKAISSTTARVPNGHTRHVARRRARNHGRSCSAITRR